MLLLLSTGLWQSDVFVFEAEGGGELDGKWIAPIGIAIGLWLAISGLIGEEGIW